MALLRKRAMTSIIIVSTLLSFLGCGEVDVSQYKGDGRIIPVGTGIGRGYLIEFDTFNLSEPFSKKYIIVDYPPINRDLLFGLAFRAEDRGIEDELEGVLSYRVSSFGGEALFSCSLPLKDWIHSSEIGDDGKIEYFSYVRDGDSRSYFNPRDRRDIPNLNTLYLDVQYEPKSTKKKVSATIQLRVGGYL